MVYPLPSLVTVLPAPRPSDPSPGLPGVPPLTNSDRTVRAGSGSTCCPSSSARLSASDIQILLVSGPQGPGTEHLIDTLSTRHIPTMPEGGRMSTCIRSLKLCTPPPSCAADFCYLVRIERYEDSRN